MIRVISPDLGGGFGNKVPVYPGYVMSILASILLETPVKWIEDRTGNLISTGFARDVYLHGEMALRKDGKILGVRMHTDADHGAFFSDAQPSKFKIGLMHSAFACYDIPAAHLTARGMYTNKAPGGVAYRCSFRVTEAMYFQERMVQEAANDLGMDQAQFRRINFVRDDDFPHRTPFGFLTDSGQYGKCLDVGLAAVGYDDFLKQKEEARKNGRLLGIGISTMTEPLGAGNSREYDILGIKMFDSAELRVHMTGKATAAHRREVAGAGPRDDVGSDRGPRARHSRRGHHRGRGRHRHRPVRHGHVRLAQHARGRRGRGHGVARRSAPRHASWPRTCWKCRRKTSIGSSVASTCAARATEVSPSRNARWRRTATCPTAWSPGSRTTPTTTRPTSRGRSPATSQLSRSIPQTGVWDVLNVVAVDDCGVRINPMIVEGQIMGGLTEAYAMANMQFITFDAEGNCIGSNFMDYLLPTAWETPGFELHEVVTPCPHHPIGAKGIGECATVGGPAAFVNAVMDAISGHGRSQHRHAVAADRVYEAITQRHDVSGAPPMRSDDS